MGVSLRMHQQTCVTAVVTYNQMTCTVNNKKMCIIEKVGNTRMMYARQTNAKIGIVYTAIYYSNGTSFYLKRKREHALRGSKK